MNKALIVARWEFWTTVKRRSYILTVIGMPLFFGLMLAVPVLTGRTAAASRPLGAPVGIVDHAGLVDVEFAAEQAARREEIRRGSPGAPVQRLVEYPTREAALVDLAARRVSAVYEIDADYSSTGVLKAYGQDGGLFAQVSGGQRQAQVVDAIRAGLLRSSLSGDALTRAYAPAARVERYRVDDSGTVTADRDAADAGPILGGFAVLILLTMSIFFSAGFLQQATIDDRQNRVLEILISSVTSDQLLIGKILGLGAAGLLQVLFYTVILIVPASTALAIIQVPLADVFLSLVYFVIGYLLFASLMAGTGMIGRTPQEAGQLSAVWTLTAASPLWFLSVISQAPNGTLARALSYFPLTSPVTMILRLTTTQVPAIDIAGSIAVGAVSVYVALRAATKVFRASLLMYGKRPTLPEVMRWLRAA